eukprot:COSAG02_NODE_43549_length_373_cov_3.806569_1_plen_27_part_10
MRDYKVENPRIRTSLRLRKTHDSMKAR